MFSKSYMALLLHRLVVDGENGVGNRAPRTIGSSASPLLARLRGGHHDVKASERDWRTVWLWIESGALYAGSAAAIRNVEEQDYYGGAWGAGMHWVYGVGRSARCIGCHTVFPDKNVTGLPFDWGIRRDKEAKTWSGPRGHYERLTTTNDPARYFDSSQLVDYTTPQNSAILRVPLAKSAGGLEHDGKKAVFADTNDPDYKKLLDGLNRAQAIYNQRPAWGMNGWKPNKDYIREMKRFGVLPESFDVTKDPFDPFETDQKYWRSLWPKPNQKP